MELSFMTLHHIRDRLGG